MVSGKGQDLQRIFSALIVPMNPDEGINFAALDELIEAQLKDGVEGFYCCGSSGEGLLLSNDERKQVLERVLHQVAGRVPVVAHVGTIRTRDVMDLAAHAKSAGAAAVSMIPPYYYHFSMDEITDYYLSVLDAVPGLRAIIYNIPQFTGVEFSKDNAARLLGDPRIIGIKHTSQNLYSLERMHTAYPEKVYINGFDEMFLGALSMGAQATIGTTVNLFAPVFLRLREAYQSGRMEQALALQETINGYVEGMIKVGIFSAVKYGWTLRGIDCGVCRRPFAPLSAQDQDFLRQLYRGVCG